MQIVPAVPADVPLVSLLIVSAFRNLEVVKWLVPDPAEADRVLLGHIRLHVEHAIASGHGHADMTLDRAGAAVWMHSNGTEIPPPADYDVQLDRLCGPYAERLRKFDAILAAHHPRGVPHQHLAFAAVSPDRQRRGLGTAVLNHHHLHLDQHGLAAFLEASSEESARLYEQLGYRRLTAYTIGDSNVKFVPMWRDPGRHVHKRLP